MALKEINTGQNTELYIFIRLIYIYKKHNTITKACHTLCLFFVSLSTIYKQAYVQIAMTQKWGKKATYSLAQTTS